MPRGPGADGASRLRRGSPRLPFVRLDFSILGLALACSACERGCLTRWFVERSVGSAGTEERSSTMLSGIDCPPRLFRCVDGALQSSLGAHIPADCTGEGCACPWKVEAACVCVSDNVALPLSPHMAARQLCSPGEHPSVKPAPTGSPPSCDEAGYVCSASVLFRCDEAGKWARSVTLCERGCALEGFALDEPHLTPGAATQLLCIR